MKAGIGYCNGKDARTSGMEVAKRAIENGNVEKPGLVLAFCGGLVDPAEFYEGLRSIIGNGPPIVGGSAIGLITNQQVSYDGRPTGAAVLESDSLELSVCSAGDLDKNERLAGRRLAEKLSHDRDGKLLLIFYDSVKRSPTQTTPPIMNASPLLLDGLGETLGPSFPVIGAGLVGDYDFGPTQQFCGFHVGTQTVVGALLKGDFQMDYAVMHGCTPMDGIYHTITRIEGPIIYEVDGKPVVSIIDGLYGNQDWRNQKPLKRLAIGLNLGEKFGPYNESQYVNRLITGALPGGEGIVLFEPDLAVGSEFQFMLRDSNKMIQSAKDNSQELLKAIGKAGRKPALGLYIDCAGRTANYSDTQTEEALEVSQVLRHHNVPLLGFYSGVEIAPLAGKSRGLDWTGVLVIFSGSENDVW